MNQEEKQELWEAYQKEPTQDIREKIIVEYAPLVKIVAGRMSMYLGNKVEFDDLCSFGIFGLIDAIDRYDLGKDVKFETYASLRIRGAILDQIRKMDWIPRTIRQKQKKIESASREIEIRTGHAASDEELAKELGISESEMTDWQTDVNMTNIVSLNDFIDQGTEPVMDTENNSHFIEPEEKISKDELKEKLEEALKQLTEKENKVILLYYYEEMTLKEISEVLSVSESRVSQIHTKALKKMRDIMGDYMDIFTDI